MSAAITPTSKCTSKNGRERCRVHGNYGALAALHSSHIAASNLAASKRHLDKAHDFEEYVEARDQIAQDQLIYDATIFGGRKLERLIRKADHDEREELYKRQRLAQQYRSEQLATDPTYQQRVDSFKEAVTTYSITSYSGFADILANRKELTRLPYRTPVAFLLKDGSVVVSRAADGLLHKENGRVPLSSVLPIRGNFLETYHVFPSAEDTRNAEFNLLLHPEVKSTVAVRDVQEMHVLAEDVFAGDLSEFTQGREVSEHAIPVGENVPDQSDYLRIRATDFLFEGEASNSGHGADWWDLASSGFHLPGDADIRRVVVPQR